MSDGSAATPSAAADKWVRPSLENPAYRAGVVELVGLLGAVISW